MSQQVNNDEYLSLEYFKRSLGINSDNNDDRLLIVVQEANAEVRQILLPFASEVIQGTEAYKNARQMSLLLARYSWLQQTGQDSRAKQYFEQYAEKKASLLATFSADRTARTLSTAVASDPKDARLYLPSQKETFVLDFF